MLAPMLQEDPVVQKYKSLLLQASTMTQGPSVYVPGDQVLGDSLREFSDEPRLCGPLVCQLCDDSFCYQADFSKHLDAVHAGEREYRKRVLYLMEERGCRPITGQEKRIMVQNFAHFQQFSRLGSKGNTFAHAEEVPRCEAACVFCQQKDWLEHRHKLCLQLKQWNNFSICF